MTLETSIRDLAEGAKVTATPAAPKSKGKTAAAVKGTTSPAKPKDQPLSRRVRQHRLMMYALLRHLDMIDAHLDVDRLAGRKAAPGKVCVAVYDAGGTGGAGAARMEQLLSECGMRVDRVGPEELRAGVLFQFDLVVVPGGSGRMEAAAIGEQGRQNIRRFVEQGGNYLGICAGAFLCLSGDAWRLNLINAKTVSPHWERGKATLKIELTPEGRKILGDYPGLVDVLYHNGPIVTRAGVPSLPEYQVLAYFRTEVAKNNAPQGIQVNAPAIAVGRCGKGRVVLISPHPEQTPGLENLVRHAAQWAVGQHPGDAARGR
jgi:putative intracellular protease/amidase